MFRKVARPSNPRGLAFGWLIGPEQDAKIRDALPGWAIVLDVKSPTSVSLADMAAGRALVGLPADTPIGLIGHSAGCQSVRSVLQKNLVRPEILAAVHVSDGTHADVPPEAEPWKIQIWADLIKRARAGEIIFTATCSSMTYTKGIPAGQPGRAWPTSWVLGRALGGSDDTLKVGEPILEGGLYVEKFPSGDCDAAAHNRQLAVVLPATLAAYWSGHGVDPSVEVPEPQEDPATGPTEPPPAPPVDAWLDQANALPERLALWAENEATLRVREVPPGSNDGPRIREYDRAPTVRGGEPFHAVRVAWCAKAAAFGLFTVALGDKIPTLRVSGIEFESDAAKDGTLVHEPRRGDLVIWQRDGGQAWWRHVGIVLEVRTDGTFQYAAGNEGDTFTATGSSNIKGDHLRGFVRIG